jgi:hypothetical protein
MARCAGKQINTGWVGILMSRPSRKTQLACCAPLTNAGPAPATFRPMSTPAGRDALRRGQMILQSPQGVRKTSANSQREPTPANGIRAGQTRCKGIHAQVTEVPFFTFGMKPKDGS